MAGEKQLIRVLKDHRRPAIVILAAASACMLAAPALIVSASPGGWVDFWFTFNRMMALYAFTLIFMNIVTGALAPYFYAVFKPRGQYLVHLTTGILGFLLALTHGLVVLVKRYFEGYNAVWVIGPVAMTFLVVTIAVALDRKALKKVWRAIHQMNYVIFVAIFVKAVVIGTDLRVDSGSATAARVLLSTYVFLAGLALIARLRRFQVQAAARRKRAMEAE